jgi:hypothetical protein
MIALLLLAAAEPPPVVVSSLTTEQLAAQCMGSDRDTRATFCTGYILGVFDTLSRARAICPAAGKASTAEVIAAPRKYIRKYHKKWSAAPAFVVRDALREAFPCGKRK